MYALIFVAVASAWNIFSGFSGYISLGHAVFFGSGAYALGIAARDWHVTGVGVFGLLPLAAVGRGADRGAVRPGGAAGQAAHLHRDHDRGVLHLPADGLQLLLHRWLQRPGRAVPVLEAATYNNPFYYIALACAVGAIALAWLIRRSRFGLQLRAIRDDEDRARGLGVHAMRVKLAAFVLSGAVTGLVGGGLVLLHRPGEPPRALTRCSTCPWC